MVRILGTPGRSRQLRTVGALASCLLLVGLILAPGALAVHDLEFQLDGNVVDDAASAQDFDWANLFDANGNELGLPAGFTASSFERDFVTNTNGSFNTSDTTTFATGSKDTLPITPGWQCNFDNNVNSKIDVMNSYAATYEAPNGDEILYFALERNTNTGDANVAFWFLQDEVACESTGGSAAFTGDHTDGDLLIVSEFSGGGTVSTINVYRWEGGANGTLNPDPVASGVDCKVTAGNDTACGTANTGTITTPWLTANFKDKVGHTLRVAEFFEGGVNLTDANLSGRCFNTFLGDTRSSTSLTATLFDYALGQLGSCASGLVTTPSAASVSIGTGSASVTDSADLDVTGADTWSGTLSFFLCGPIATGTCDTGGVPIGSAVAVNQGTTMPVVSSAATVTSVGRYCWRGFFDSATEGVPDATDSTVGECFTVTPVTPTLTTQAGADVTLGSPITDTATLSGTATQPGTNGPNATYPSINATNGAPAGGTITWTVRGPDSCDPSGLTVTGSPAAVSGDDTYGPVNATPTAVGDYTFVATYSGSSPNTLGAGGSCPPGANDGDEVVTVTGEAALSTAQDWLPNDTATITGPTALSGTATFTLFTGTDCGAGDDDTIVYGPVDVPVSGASPQTAETANTTLVLEADSGGYSWLVSYDDDVLDDPADTCETTTITITD
jgi:hypothetical protein